MRWGAWKRTRPLGEPGVDALNLSSGEASVDVQIEPDDREGELDGRGVLAGALSTERIDDVLMQKV